MWPAVGVVNDDYVLDPEQMLSDRYGTKSVHRAAAGDYHGKYCRGGGDFVALRISHNLAGINFTGQGLGHRSGNIDRARIVAVHDDRL